MKKKNINKLRLSIIIPTYNYEKKIIKKITQLINNVTKFEKKFEIIVVDDGSIDNTPLLIKNLKFKKKKYIKKILLNKNYGKGYAIKQGIKLSRGKNIIFIDCDLPYLNNLKKVYFSLKYDLSDLSLVSRVKKSNKKFKTKNNILYGLRKFFSIIISFVVKNFLIDQFPDTQAGLKGFQKKYKKKILKYKTNGFLFDIEILKISIKNNLRIKSFKVPDNYKYYTLSYVYNFKLIFYTLKDLLYLFIKK